MYINRIDWEKACTIAMEGDGQLGSMCLPRF